MSVDVEIKVYFDFGNAILDAEGNAILDAEGLEILDSGFNNAAVDVLTGVNYSRGNFGRGVKDRVGDIGQASFRLKNSTANSAGTAGYYSPDHSSVRQYFSLDTNVRISMTEGVTEHEEWEGRITRIAPAFGTYRERSTDITCEDWMADAARDTVRGITVQSGKRDDELLTTLIALSSHQPGATDFSTGDDTYTYALHDENSDTSSLMRVFQKIAMSGFGKIYLTGYNTLTYRSRSDLLLSGTPVATLDNSMVGLTVTRDKKQRVKTILVKTFPVQLDGTPAVLWASQREIQVPAGETITFDISLRDPSGRATRVAATSITDAVANTDFKMSSVSGSGTDLNSNLTVGYELKADVVSVTMSNSSASNGFVWFYQVRGLGVYLYEPMTNTIQTGQPDGEVLEIEMVYQDDNNVGEDIATLLNYWFLMDQSDVEDVIFIANTNQDLMDAAFLPCGSLVSIIEDQTGINNNFMVNGWRKSYLPGKKLQVVWNMVPANQITGACRLDVVGLAELDSTAYLGA